MRSSWVRRHPRCSFTPPRPGRQRVLAVLAGWLLCACPAGAPPPEPAVELGSLTGRIYSDRAVLCVPGPRWEEAQGAWSFRGSATLLVLVQETPESLEFFFRPGALSRHQEFTVEWDGEPLAWDDTSDEPGYAVRVPPERSGPGRHVLRLLRVGIGHEGHRRSSPQSGFEEIGFRVAGLSQRFEPEAFRDEVLFDFIDVGLAGAGVERLSGFLFDGPRQIEAHVTAGEGASLWVPVQNLSRAPARFSLRVGQSRVEERVAPLAGGEFRVSLPPGRTSAVFRAEGPEKGLFLWGTPHVVDQTHRGLAPLVLVTLDTTRRDALSAFGGREEVTPNLARFATRATAFERAYATAPWTLPSHGSMFTGLYPSEHRLGVSGRQLPAGVEPLPELLRRRGYLTAGFAGGRLSSSYYGVARGFHRYLDPAGAETRADDLTDAALAFLEEHHDRPFLLFVNYFDPHGLYEAPAALAERTGVPDAVASLAGQPHWQALARREPGSWERLLAGGTELSPEGLAYLRASYLAEVAFMDQQLGRLFAALERHGLFDPALIVMIADHGEALGERGYLTHSKRLDPEIIDIPLLVKWPGQSEPQRIPAPASGVDVFPTFLEAAGVDPPDHRGVSLAPPSALARLLARPRVLMEEHGSILHSIDGFGSLGHHVFGVQEHDSRLVIWKDGAECSTPPDWEPRPCQEGWDAALARAREFFPQIPEVSPRDAGGLGREEEENLEALGYL